MQVTLKNETTQVTVVTLGAELQSFQRKDGVELLWQGNPRFWSGRATVLFPTVGALRGRRAKIAGEWYAMPQHGFAKDQEFSVLAQGNDFVQLILQSNAETKKCYPFDFTFVVGYRLYENRVVTEFAVKNCGQQDMPFAIGGHPGINVPMEKGDQFEDYLLAFEKEETTNCPYVDFEQVLIDDTRTKFSLVKERIIPLRYSLFANDALVFDALNSQKIKLYSSNSGRGVELDFAGFPMLGVWSPQGEGPLVALEPWVGCATTTQESDIFEEKRHMQVALPGETRTFSFSLRYF